MKKLLKTFTLILLSTILLSSCKLSEWPTMDYSRYANTWDFPPAPFCVEQNISETFEYSAQFNACRLDVMNYESALNTYYYYASGDAKNLLEKVNRDVLSVKECFDEHFAYNDFQPSHCQSVKIPRHLELYSVSSTVNNVILADTINFSAGIPHCAKSQEYAPSSKSSYNWGCEDSLIEFLDPKSKNSAQSQYNRYVDWLSAEIRARKEMVISQFNCKAEGKYICSMPFI